MIRNVLNPKLIHMKVLEHLVIYHLTNCCFFLFRFRIRRANYLGKVWKFTFDKVITMLPTYVYVCLFGTITVFWNLIADLTKVGFRTILRNKTESLYIVFDYCMYLKIKNEKTTSFT